MPPFRSLTWRYALLRRVPAKPGTTKARVTLYNISPSFCSPGIRLKLIVSLTPVPRTSEAVGTQTARNIKPRTQESFSKVSRKSLDYDVRTPATCPPQQFEQTMWLLTVKVVGDTKGAGAEFMRRVSAASELPCREEAAPL